MTKTQLIQLQKLLHSLDKESQEIIIKNKKVDFDMPVDCGDKFHRIYSDILDLVI